MVISKLTAIEVLNIGLSTGADYAEIYYQDNQSSSYVRRYKKVYSISSGRTCGVGIRLLKGNQQIYGYTSNLSKKSLVELARELSFGIQGEGWVTITSLKEKKHKNISPAKIPHSEWSVENKLAYLEKGEKKAYEYSSLVSDVMTRLFEEDEYIEVFNSDGFYTRDTRTRTRLMASVIASDGEQFQEGFTGPGLSKGLELLEEIDFESECVKAATSAVSLLKAIDGPSGEMPVVIGNGFGGVLFHEACGHPLEGSSISRALSPFAEKYNKKIASDVVNAFDDGTIPYGWGSENVDDEGNEPTKNQLIKDGVLVSYMLDRYTARRMGGDFKPTGSCRRESYRNIPTTRMTNTYIGAGDSDPKDIIASVKDGIYCKSFNGGQVNPATDQFIFTSDVSYTIKDGKLDNLIKPVSLIGYGYEIINRITMVGNDLERAPGVCGASSGSCYVEVGQPTILISKILVGGKGEE